jgi:hypothetical protein
MGRAIVQASKGASHMKNLHWLCTFALMLSLAACESKGGTLRVDEVEPPTGVTPGGDQVVIKGSGFQPGKTQVEIRFGRARAEQVSIASANRIVVTTPAGDKGPVDVTLMFDHGPQFKIPQGFKYVSPTSGDDVRRAFFNKPGTTPPKAGQTNATTTPPPK